MRVSVDQLEIERGGAGVQTCLHIEARVSNLNGWVPFLDAQGSEACLEDELDLRQCQGHTRGTNVKQK